MSGSPEVVWLLRHAETATPGIFHGAESDVELSDRGRRQAVALADWFQEHRPSVVVSSHMKRAIATAQPLFQRQQLPHHIEPDFHERRVGILSGTDFTASSGLWAETLAHWTSGRTDFTTPGAESFAEIQARVLGAWNRTVSRFPGERVAIVAHGVVCKVLLLSLLKRFTPANWSELGPIPNCAVNEFVSIDGHWQDRQLLQVPPPVLALSEGRPTGIGSHQIQRPT